jgi:hypothetical protein
MATKQEFISALDEAFKDDRDLYEGQDGDSSTSAHYFLAENVFDFTLYDTAKDVQWCMEALSVIRAILTGTTFDMFRDPANEEMYLKMVNMPFMDGLLEWGGSIRGAWFDTHGDKRFFEFGNAITVERCDIKVFMEALLEWADAHLNVA